MFRFWCKNPACLLKTFENPTLPSNKIGQNCHNTTVGQRLTVNEIVVSSNPYKAMTYKTVNMNKYA